jgi:chain length determinant protein EpsF
MNLQQFLLILKARRKVLGLTVLAAVMITLVASLLWPKSYTASTAVFLDSKPDPLSIMSAAGGGMGMGALQSFIQVSTQIEIIKSERVAVKVVKALRLDQDPKITEEWKADTDGRGDKLVWLAHLLQRKLDVKPEKESTVIDIEFTAKDPKLAAEIANQFAQAYVDTSLELKIEPARQYAAWFGERSKAMRGELEKAQTALSDDQRKKGIAAIEERLDVENARLLELSTQLSVAQGLGAESSSRQAQAKNNKDIMPEVMQSILITTLKTDIARVEGSLEKLAGQLGRNHPQYKRSEMELESMRQKLEQETAKMASSIGTADRVNTQRIASIRAALEAQKAKVLQLKQQRGEVAVSAQDVVSAQKSYEIAMQRLNQTSMESKIDQTNVVVLYPATEPVSASSPRLVLNVILALFFGMLLGVGLALRSEAIDHRIRVVEDIVDLLKLPVLAIVDKAASTGNARARPALPWWRRGGLAANT